MLRRDAGDAGTRSLVAISSVGAALAASWFAIWGLVLRVHLDDRPDLVTVQVVRFYVPALGAIALLGAWLVTRIPGRAWWAGLITAAVIAAMFGLGVWSFYAMYARSASLSADRVRGLVTFSGRAAV